MIFDRTEEDVKAAKNLIETKVKNFIKLTEDEKAILEKGTATTETLNRIENKISELRSVLNDMGYWNTNVSIKGKDWEASEIFDLPNFNRILKNLSILIQAFYVYSETPNVPNAEYIFTVFNDIEKILFDLEEIKNIVVNNYRQCGAYECGQEG